ncbi:MAG: hypothetical protein H6728_12810 [Myxococcales bacterium]|nr:hypothetical protein [Myxococcales bacterium]MCB9643949.1 hypothetical protein [Myxococcales bacterium]
MPHLIVLGPQRLEPIVHNVLQGLGVDGDIALISAGWQEREEEDEELREVLGTRCRVHNLRVHGRCEEVYHEDTEFFEAHRARQDQLRELQSLYRYRLDLSLDAARYLFAQQGEETLLQPEREDAIDALRRLDQHHVRRLQEIHDDFESKWNSLERTAVQKQREEIQSILGYCGTIAIAGGHVAVLLNRIRMLGIESFFKDHHLVAWSAGAMALSEKVVLFHDKPPQGAGAPEILDLGLGYFKGLLPLPHARRRLNLNDPARVALLAQRFAPSLCFALDEGSHIQATDKGWKLHPRTRLLTAEGQVHNFLHPKEIELPSVVLDPQAASSADIQPQGEHR